MKAIIWTKYGSPDVLQLGEIEKPTPKADELLIEIKATTAFMGDCELRGLRFSPLLAIPLRIYAGIWKPTRIKVLGQEFAGEVVEIGQDVSQYKVGDRVFGSAGFQMGSYAEYISVPEAQRGLHGPVAPMPGNFSYEEAAPVIIGGSEALHFMRVGQVKAGEHILINGAGGSIGTYAVQMAKHLGAEVTAVDHTSKLDMMREIGADHVIDYTKETFSQSGKTYDVIFDVVGKSSFAGCMACLRENGRYLVGNPQTRHRMQNRFRARTGNKKVILKTAEPTKEDLLYLKKMIEDGHLKTIIDRTYSLEKTAEAHHYAETGQKTGHVVISVNSSKGQ